MSQCVATLAFISQYSRAHMSNELELGYHSILPGRKYAPTTGVVTRNFNVSLPATYQYISKEAPYFTSRSIQPFERRKPSWPNTFHHIASHMMPCRLLRSTKVSCWCVCPKITLIELYNGRCDASLLIDALSAATGIEAARLRFHYI